MRPKSRGLAQFPSLIPFVCPAVWAYEYGDFSPPQVQYYFTVILNGGLHCFHTQRGMILYVYDQIMVIQSERHRIVITHVPPISSVKDRLPIGYKTAINTRSAPPNPYMISPAS